MWTLQSGGTSLKTAEQLTREQVLPLDLLRAAEGDAQAAQSGVPENPHLHAQTMMKLCNSCT